MSRRLAHVALLALLALLSLSSVPDIGAQATRVAASGTVLRSAPAARGEPRRGASAEFDVIVLSPKRPYPSAEPSSMRSMFVEIPDAVAARGGTFYLAEPGPWRTLGPRGGMLEPGDSAPLAFTLMVPSLAAAGENLVGVVRFVPYGRREYYDVPMLVDVASRTQVTLEAVQPVIGVRSGGRVRTAWTIRNSGNADVDVALSFTAASGWRAQPATSGKIRVGRGSAVTVPVDVDIPVEAGSGDFALVGTAQTTTGHSASSEQGMLVSGAAGRAGAGGLATVRVGSAQDDLGQSVQAYALDWMVPILSDIRFSGRVGAVSAFNSGLTATALGGLGFADRLRQFDLRGPGWSLSAGNVGLSSGGLSGIGLFGDGVIGTLDQPNWRGDAVALRPVFGEGRYLYGRTQRRVGRAWLGVMANDLTDDIFVQRTARTFALDAAMPTLVGDLDLQAGIRQTSFGDGAALQMDLGRRVGPWGYTLSAGHAPGGSSAFAAAENTWAADAFRDLGANVSLSASLWGNDDQARSDRSFRSAGWTSQGRWRVRPSLSLDAELRQSSWESQTPLGGVANGDRTFSLGAALSRGEWRLRGSARSGTVTREADLLSLGRVTTDATQAALTVNASRAFAVATFSASASAERTGAGVGLPAQQSSFEFRAERLPLFSRRAYVFAEYGVVLLGTTGARLDAQTLGVDIQLPLQLGVTVEASRNALFRRAGSSGTPWVVALKMQRGLALPGFGSERVLGRVFVDENANGQRDRGERSLPGVIVDVDGVPTSTDGEGRFRGARGGIGAVDVRSLPPGLLVAPTIADRSAGDIAIVSTAPVQVQLRVENPERVPMATVDVSRAIVILRDARGRVWSNAVGSDGRVRFDALPLGEYHIEVETSGVGESLVPLTTLPMVEVTGMRRLQQITVILGPRPMRVQPLPAGRRIQLDGAQARGALP